MCSGCEISTPRKDLSVFYTLGNHCLSKKDSKGIISATGKQQKRIIINLFIDEVPAYADCPYVVVKLKPTRLHFSEINRWAEPLGEACARILSDQLSDEMSDCAMIISSVHANGNVVPCDYRLSVSFTDFIYNGNKQSIILKCNWSLHSYNKKQQVLVDRYASSVPVIADNISYEAIVRSMELALCEFAHGVSDKIKQLCLQE
jgi:uncharacterized lipoprotein YmbA